MNKSNQINELAAALAKAQGVIKSPEKNRTVTVSPKDKPQYSFDYADLGAITDAIREPLSKNGLAYTHLIEQGENALMLVTMLIHTSGQWILTEYPLPAGAEPKILGAAITYGKRYSISALTGCVADDDLDADTSNTVEYDKRPGRPISNQQPQRPAHPIRNVTQVKLGEPNKLNARGAKPSDV